MSWLCPLAIGAILLTLWLLRRQSREEEPSCSDCPVRPATGSPQALGPYERLKRLVKAATR